MSDERIEKLPKWAREHIRDLERQRDSAINALNQYVDDQTPAPFFDEDWVSTGEQQGPSRKKRYFNTHKMEAVHGGIRLRILLRGESSMSHEKPCIELSWEPEERHLGDIIFQPYSFQQARLIRP